MRSRSVFTDLLLLAGIEAFMMCFLDVRYLFYDTVVAGGDTASWQGIANHLVTELLPHGRLTGWDMGNFCGYPNFSFYFLPPFLLAALPTWLLQIPLTVTLKLAIASGIFLFPVTTYLGLRSMGYRFPGPIIGAAASLLLLFNELYTMFGGNVLSTNTGEFCYMFAFALFAWFIGSISSGVEKEEAAVKNGVLLGLIGLSHLFVFVPAVCLMVTLYLCRGKIRYLFKVSLVGFGLMAFWILPLLAYRHPYTTPVYMIWQEFVSWRYALMGIGMILLFVGPRFGLAALNEMQRASAGRPWYWALVSVASLGGFILFYVGGTFLVRGQGLLDHGLTISPLSVSPLGSSAASFAEPLVLPVSLAAGVLVAALGLLARRTVSRVERFSYTVGALLFLFAVLFASAGFHLLLARAIPNPRIREFFLGAPSMAAIQGAVCLGLVFFLFVRRPFKGRILRIAPEAGPSRFVVLLGLGLGCVVLYFAAHYLQVPDIRFLPPLGLALIYVLFADTLEPLLASLSAFSQSWAALAVTYAVILVILFGTAKADNWFRYNNRGYENTVGHRDFERMNSYLRKSYPQYEKNPLNAPRAGYEKCSLYEPYGGDRVFESMPYFAGRQTMEGIHYASSMAARFTAFIQSAYSNEIKTPRAYVLSRMNAAALPAYFNLYNISELILLTREGKQSIESSPEFEKKVTFGNMTVYRYKNCDGRYVDVPKRRPLLYSGTDWVEDFYRWYREGSHLDLLMVPSKYVEDKADRAALGPTAGSIDELPRLRSDLLDRRGVQIETHIEHQKIRFFTNRVGVPHLVKVSYFPNWKVDGANGVYPVSPHLMVVIPRQQSVTLTYGRNPWEVIGHGITGMTILLLLLRSIAQRAKRKVRGQRSETGSQRSEISGQRSEGRKGHSAKSIAHSENPQGREQQEKTGRRGDGGTGRKDTITQAPNSLILKSLDSFIPRFLSSSIVHPGSFILNRASCLLDRPRVRASLTGLALLAAAGLIAGGALARNRPVRAYIAGYREFKAGMDLKQAGKEKESRPRFEEAIRIMTPVFTPVPIDDHQDVINCLLFTAGSHENLGERSIAEGLYWKILKDYPFSRYVGEAYVKIGRLKRQEGKGEEAAAFFEKAIQMDPWSVWAKYAKEDKEQSAKRIEHSVN